MLQIKNGRSVFVMALALWLVATTLAVTVAVWQSRQHRAVIGMAWGLILLWILLAGTLMHRFREPVRKAVSNIRLDWRLKFILLATTLALIEEGITTSMTNLAPLFGVKVGEAYIAASANYLDVVALHSVVVFVPMFVGWAILLWRYDFSPFAVFVLFGLTGTAAEMSFGGPQHALEFGLWIFVYGLMVYLPSYCVPSDRKTRAPRWWHYPLAAIAPVRFHSAGAVALNRRLTLPASCENPLPADWKLNSLHPEKGVSASQSYPARILLPPNIRMCGNESVPKTVRSSAFPASSSSLRSSFSTSRALPKYARTSPSSSCRSIGFIWPNRRANGLPRPAK